MPLSIFPVAVSSSSGSAASAITCSSANTMYQAAISVEPGIYTVTCVNTTIAIVEFYSGISTLVSTAKTVSGTVTLNIGSTVDRIRLWTDTGSNVVVTITKTASALSDTWSGTLDTITSSTTYTGTSTSGYAYAVLVGGGGGGGATQSYGAEGGASGAVVGKLVQLTGSMPVVIGALGAGGSGGNNNGSAGGTSTFAGMSAGGGSGGLGGSRYGAGQPGGIASGGTYNVNGAPGGQGPGGNGPGGGGGSTTPVYTFVKNGTTGAGGGGSPGYGAGAGGGSGIGTGGSGGPNYGSGNSASGYGAGGGGSSGSGGGGLGGNGTPGVLYILKF